MKVNDDWIERAFKSMRPEYYGLYPYYHAGRCGNKTQYYRRYIMKEKQLSNTNPPVRYVVRTHLFSSVLYNTYRYRKLAFACALKVIMYTSGWCTIYKEELKDEKWTLVRRWDYD